MATATSTKRLRQDYLRIHRDPVPYVEATPHPSNILEWYDRLLPSLPPLTFSLPFRHYVVKGPEDTPYYGEKKRREKRSCTKYLVTLSLSLSLSLSPPPGGYYHGKLIFPRDYPFKPPRIIMLTPNGRFQTHTRLCLSISDFHPDTWNPAWSVATILTGLLSFMVRFHSEHVFIPLFISRVKLKEIHYCKSGNFWCSFIFGNFGSKIFYLKFIST